MKIIPRTSFNPFKRELRYVLVVCREQEERSRGELRDDDDDDDETGASNPFRPIREELATAQVN